MLQELGQHSQVILAVLSIEILLFRCLKQSAAGLIIEAVGTCLD